MRADALGLWWEDRPVVKVLKEKIKVQPPEPIWLAPEYLPGLAEARAFNVPLMTQDEIANSQGQRFIFDIECYLNYFAIGFVNFETGKCTYAEMTAGQEHLFNATLVQWLCKYNTIVGFNSNNYDIPMLTMALAGRSCAELKAASDAIIKEERRPSDVLRSYKLKKGTFNHIDIMEVAPLRASLKLYSGRLHAPRMQDLPFAPETWLSEPQIAITRYYMINDLANTCYLKQSLLAQLDLRHKMSEEYSVDLRSKSDAQIAETVIVEEIERITGSRIRRPTIEPGTQYNYAVPNFITFQSDLMRWVLHTVSNTKFVVSEFGNVGMPAELAEMKITIANGVYRMGIGGLHSSESCAGHVANSRTILADFDVTSYYPFIILNQRLAPDHLGAPFLRVYKGLVDRRIEAKRAKDKNTAESLKIVINGSYGKLGSMYSALYAPRLLIQVTITGQLSLLMLIERMEMSGIPVVSANTDGIVMKCPVEKEQLMYDIVKQWELETNFQTEESRYLALYSRDINNYIAVKADVDENGKFLSTPPKDSNSAFKTKGAYANPWRVGQYGEACLHKNPTATICVEALENLLYSGKSVDDTINECKDIRKFVSVRNVKGGAVKVWREGEIEYLGKSVRWYYAKDCDGPMVYARSGNKVPKSDGAMPCMDLPKQFPEDVDHDWYVNETLRILKDIGYSS